MNIEQVRVGTKQPLGVGGRVIQTGIYKSVSAERLNVTDLGLESDAICNRKHHGGPDQAVYLYSVEDYEFWSERLGATVAAGTFGENLTVSGFDLSEACIGDRFESADLVLEVAAPRIPCNTLAARMDDKTFAKQFVQVAKSGAYCRVIRTGSVGAGDSFEYNAYAGDRITLATFFNDCYRAKSVECLERYLALPIDERARAKFKAQLREQSD